MKKMDFSCYREGQYHFDMAHGYTYFYFSKLCKILSTES